MIFFGWVGCATSNDGLDFGGDRVNDADTDFLKRNFYRCEIGTQS